MFTGISHFRFALKTYLNNHMLRHKAGKDHACSVCSKLFKTKTEMKAHEKRHEAVR